MQDVTTSPDLSGTCSVLIVEDEFLIAMETEAVLTESGYAVVGTAASVEKALRLLETMRPDVAILDVNLRGHSVSPVAARLMTLSVPFVLASAYSSENADGSDVLAGVINVGKPIRKSLLLEALHSVLTAR